jgi:hypothetical protein
MFASNFIDGCGGFPVAPPARPQPETVSMMRQVKHGPYHAGTDLPRA